MAATMQTYVRPRSIPPLFSSDPIHHFNSAARNLNYAQRYGLRPRMAATMQNYVRPRSVPLFPVPFPYAQRYGLRPRMAATMQNYVRPRSVPRPNSLHLS
jgi:hypothetical protein